MWGGCRYADTATAAHCEGATLIANKLKTFIKVAELGSFRKAGEALFLSSIAVKKQIDKLESELKVQLFERSGRGVTLTPAGNVLFEGALRIERISEEVVSATHAAALRHQQQIRIGMSFLRPGQSLANLWRQVGGNDSAYTLSFVPFGDSSYEMSASLNKLGSEIDCVLAPCDSTTWHDRYSILPVGELPLRLAMAASHPLADRDAISWADLEGRTLMMPVSRDFPTVSRLYDDIKEMHPDIEILEAPAHYDIEIFNRYAGEGFLLLAYDIWGNINPSLVLKPVDWNYSVPYGIIYAKQPSIVIEQFISDIRSALDS